MTFGGYFGTEFRNITFTSNWAFYRYDTALRALIRINQDAFGQAIAAGESGGTGWNGTFPIIGSIAIIILARAGARSRLAEYR